MNKTKSDYSKEQTKDFIDYFWGPFIRKGQTNNKKKKKKSEFLKKKLKKLQQPVFPCGPPP